MFYCRIKYRYQFGCVGIKPYNLAEVVNKHIVGK